MSPSKSVGYKVNRAHQREQPLFALVFHAVVLLITEPHSRWRRLRPNQVQPLPMRSLSNLKDHCVRNNEGGSMKHKFVTLAAIALLTCGIALAQSTQSGSTNPQGGTSAPSAGATTTAPDGSTTPKADDNSQTTKPSDSQPSSMSNPSSGVPENGTSASPSSPVTTAPDGSTTPKADTDNKDKDKSQTPPDSTK